MPSHPPLHSTLDLARGDLETAARRFTAIQLHRTELEKRLQAAVDFHREYTNRLSIGARTEPDKTNWRNADHFVAALSADLDRQREALAEADLRLEAARSEWQAQNERVVSLDSRAQQDRLRSRSRRGLVEQPEPGPAADRNRPPTAR
jgi:flagellar FliJ protein